MVDNQSGPQLVGELPETPGSISEAQDAILGLMDSLEKPEEEEQASPSEEVTEDVLEEESDEVEEEGEEPDEDTEDDESEESDEEELVNGYSRQADYTRKTQQLAEYRKQIDNTVEQYQAEIAKTQQAREQYVSAVAQAIETNYSHLNEFRNIDWNRLKTEDREEYLIKSHEYTQAQEQIRSLQDAQSKAQQEQQTASQQEMQRVAMQEHQKMASIIPDWADDGKRQAIQKAVAEFAISKGYSQDELNQLVDHRSIIVLMQAKAYEDMQSKQTTARKKKVKNKPKVVRSKAKANKADNDKTKRAKQMKRLQQTGRAEDAAGLFEDFIEL